MYKFLKGLVNFFNQIIHPYKLIGKEKVKDGAAVLVGNHYRIWDIVHMACTTKERVHFITKQELYKNKFLAYLCRKVEAIPVSRDGQDAKAIMTALRYLKKGEKISMFPEGTRSKTGEPLNPKTGVAMLAYKTQCTIVPVAIIGEGGKPPKIFKRMVINIGKARSAEWGFVSDEIEAVNREVTSGGAILKVIFENDFLTDAQIEQLCLVCNRIRPAFIKTSTGYGFTKREDGNYNYTGATVEQLALMRRVSDPAIQIKAAGGVRTLDDLLTVRKLGVTRVGATATAAILDEAVRRLYGQA